MKSLSQSGGGDDPLVVSERIDRGTMPNNTWVPSGSYPDKIFDTSKFKYISGVEKRPDHEGASTFYYEDKYYYVDLVSPSALKAYKQRGIKIGLLLVTEYSVRRD